MDEKQSAERFEILLLMFCFALFGVLLQREVLVLRIQIMG